MKWIIKIMLPALLLASCSKEGTSPEGNAPEVPEERQEQASHGMMMLGEKLDNPYSLANVKAAVASLYPSSEVEDLAPTDYYVRFLPASGDEYARLEEAGVEMADHPLDREILQDGDYYHDPTVPEDGITWQYAVVKPGFDFPLGIRYEKLEECFIPDETTATKGLPGIDWDAVEREAFIRTGNAGLLESATRAKARPEGKITIVDEGGGGKKTVGVAGVKVVANVFVKIATTYTDKNGKYEFSKAFSMKPHYRICFQNKKGFSIGLNLVLIPASVSTLGKGDASGIDCKVDQGSEASLYRRCAVNNAAYDYYTKCETLGITPPPSGLRFWILNILKPSCTMMIHHGALLDNALVSNYLGMYKIIVRLAAPDITIGTKGKSYDYAALYASTVHEMAHATHFAKAGTGYWSKFATYILSSFVMTGSSYGSGNGENAGYCEVSEMWAYYLENALYELRYGKNPQDGYNYWFKPQILASLEKDGMAKADFCSALTSEVTNRDILRDRLEEARPDLRSKIEQTFNFYRR